MEARQANRYPQAGGSASRPRLGSWERRTEYRVSTGCRAARPWKDRRAPHRLKAERLPLPFGIRPPTEVHPAYGRLPECERRAWEGNAGGKPKPHPQRNRFPAWVARRPRWHRGRRSTTTHLGVLPNRGSNRPPYILRRPFGWRRSERLPQKPASEPPSQSLQPAQDWHLRAAARCEG